MFPRFELINGVTEDVRSQTYDDTIVDFGRTIRAQESIRILVAGTSGYGHQASSVFILRRLVGEPMGPWRGFRYSGRVEVYYVDGEGSPTLPKLHQLLPELNYKDRGRIEQADVELHDLGKEEPPGWVDWGFCGGWDYVDQELNERLKSRFLLITQPFMYSVEDWLPKKKQYWPGNLFCFQLAGSDGAGWLNLDTDEDIRGFLIGQRAYRLGLPDLTAADWDTYLNHSDPDVRRRVHAVRWLIENGGPVSLTPVYGLTTDGSTVFAEPIEDRIVLEMASIRTALELTDRIRPPVVLNFGTYRPAAGVQAGFDTVRNLLQGGATAQELAALMNAGDSDDAGVFARGARENWAARWRSLQPLTREGGYRLADIEDGPRLDELITWVTGAPKRVLWLQLGRVPPPVFNQAIAKACLPPLFEGNNTAVIALNAGRPYLNVNRPYQVPTGLVRYPSGLLGTYDLSRLVQLIQHFADQIEADLNLWPDAPDHAPNDMLGTFLAAIQNPTDSAVVYFTAIRDYYQHLHNDKLNLAASLVYPLAVGMSTQVPAAAAAPLEALYQALQTEIERQGRVDLLGVIFRDGGIHDLYTALLRPTGGSLVVAPATAEAHRDPDQRIVRVALTGPTHAFGVETRAAFEFTAPYGSIQSSARFEGALPWNLDGVPWIVFERPRLRVLASQATFPPSTSIGGRIRGTDFELEVRLPVEQGRVLVHGEFDELRTIADFFALAGGVDLLRAIPAPLQALTGLGVRAVELGYDVPSATCDYVAVHIETAQPWTFFGRLQLEDIAIVLGVVRPRDLSSRVVRASFTGTVRFGTRPDSPRLQLGASAPQLRMRGQLADPALPLNDVLSVFWPGASPGWPGGREPALTELSLSYEVSSSAYQVDVRLALDWPIEIAGVRLFDILDVGLILSGAAGWATGSLAGSVTVLPDSANIGLLLVATYLGPTGWRFQGTQTSGVLSITALLKEYLGWDTSADAAIDGLGLTIDTSNSAFEFTAKTAGPWKIPIDAGVEVTGSVRVGDDRLPDGGPYGEINAAITWRGIALTVFYNYKPGYESFGIVWGEITGKIEKKLVGGQEHEVATLQFTRGTTLGGLIEKMVSWATGSQFGLSAPWSVLDSIPLNALSLVYDFTAGQVSFDVAIGPIELGFARIDGISVTYVSGSENPDDDGVKVELRGSFRWQSNPDDPLSWNAAKPETAPAPPGNGSKYLDVRLLALGQHVTMDCFKDATTVQKAIACMAKMPPTEPGKVPRVDFDADAGWLIGADLGVLKLEDAGGYFLTVQTVFDDPTLYALRVALDGAPAKIFAGLDFQVMYRQLSPTVGVYQAEIALPTAMRHLSIGAYSVTLPVFAVSVYTNGDFLLDVGFPWNMDFSRSLTVEGIVYPGIPVKGSAGLYVGKLSSATTDRVPCVVDGTFNPVLVFGFGLQVGVGLDVQYGPLSAGFSLTVVGAIEGVLGKWNPYQLTNGSSLAAQDTQLQGDYYFWLRGSVGIAGRLYGSVDFAIVKANVNVSLQLVVQLTYECYVSIAITVMASVDVSASIEINAGLFTITIHFSFSMRLKETLTFENAGTPPWQVCGPAPRGVLQAPAERRLRAARRAALAGAPHWDYLLAPASPLPLSGWWVQALTVASDEWQAVPDTASQVPAAVAMLLVETVPPASLDRTASRLRAAGEQEDTSFEGLCKTVLRWAIAAIQDSPHTPDQVDGLLVSPEELTALLDDWLVSTDARPTPIPPAAVDAFLTAQVLMSVRAEPDQDAAAAAFPMPPALVLDVAAYGSGYPGFRYAFGAYDRVSPAVLADLRAYFGALAVPAGGGAARPPRPAGRADGDPLSLGSWLFADYFLLLVRQMVQAAHDGLRDFQRPIAAGETASDVVRWINDRGQLQGPDAYTLDDLFAANPAHPLTEGSKLTIGVTRPVQARDTFASVAADSGDALTPVAVAAASAADGSLLQPGATIVYPGRPPHVVGTGETLLAVAAGFGVPFADLLSQTDVLSQRGLLLPGASLLVPFVTRAAQANDTFTSIAALPLYGGGFDAAALATRSAGAPVLRAGAEVRYPGRDPFVVRPGACLGDVAAGIGVSLTDLLANGGVLTQADLLAPVAVLALPPFAHATGAGDDLQAVASRFATSIAVLAGQAANGDVRDVFAAGVEPDLDVPHLARFQVGELIREAQRALAIQHLSGMASRFLLQGLRLPTDGIEPAAMGMWVRDVDGQLQLPPRAGLYALTGQQFPLPDISGDQAFTVSLDRAGGPGWLQFAGGGNQLQVTIEPGSPEAKRIASLTAYARANRLDVGLDALGADRMVHSDPVTYPLPTALAWQSASVVPLPYGPSADGAQQLRVWLLPDAMVNLPDPATRAVEPRFAVQVRRYDEATGATVSSPAGSHGWATIVPFTVKRVPAVAASPASETTYQIAGASGDDVVLLERLVSQVGSDDGAFDRLVLGYAPDQTGAAPRGVQTDPADTVTMGIAQVDLSTETRPPAALARPAPAGSQGRLLNTPSELLRLLWEASITRGGGFTLYYWDGADERGLPDRVFNDKGEATLSLVVLYARSGDAPQQDRLANYMNAVVTGDAFDTQNAVVVAEADPPSDPPVQVVADRDTSLAGLARGYYSELGDLAERNSVVPLRTGVVLDVSEGVFQAPPGGVALAAIATRFGTTVAALNAANPRWTGGLPDPLPFPVAIRLPRLALPAGTGVRTLAEVAAFSGESLDALAAHNRDVAGIFEFGQQVTVPGGPRVRTAAVQPGVEALIATRPRPPDVPSDPDDPRYPLDFLLHAYSLLGERVAENVDFTASTLGLPAGPTTGTAAPGPGKVRWPKVLAAGDTWTYRSAVPYARFARTEDGASPSPYAGVGGLLQVGFDWQDQYGNTLVTVLSDPQPGDGGPFNEPPLLTGYTDAIVGLGQWPSVASSWHLVPGGDPPQVELVLEFDASRYQGIIAADAGGATAVTARFTEALDPASASRVANYRIDGGVTVQAAALGGDGLTVELTVSALTMGQTYTLSVQDVLPASGGDALGGLAGFAYPSNADSRSSTVQQRAQADLGVYERVSEQLTDPNGIAYSIRTSLLPEPLALPASQVSDLLAWLIGAGGSIAAFLRDRASFGVSVPPPAPVHPVSLAIDRTRVNSDQVFPLTLSFVITRTGGAVQGDLETAPGIREAATPVPALQQDLGTAAGSGDGTLGLARFAGDFRQALSVAGSYRLEVATGVDRARVTTDQSGGTLWAVRVGLDPAQPISFAITAASRGNPAIFAPRPAANELISRAAVPIYDYATGTGISTEPSRHLDFSGVDLDTWCGQLFTAVDGLLTPEFTAPMQIVGELKATPYLQRLLDVKKALADITSLWMIPVYEGEQADAAVAREAYRQAMLVRLANAYTTRAAVQFEAAVNADVRDPLADVPPRLLGDVLSAAPEPDHGALTLISPKLTLRTAPDEPLTFLLSAPDVVRGVVGEVVDHIDLDVRFAGRTIEHQIGSVPDIKGYQASSWLAFVLDDAARPLSASLGQFPVPMVLRAFPASPAMTAQEHGATASGSDLAGVTRWDYRFTYSLPYHYPQDRVRCDVVFNVRQSPAADAGLEDAFDQLAEFVTVAPAVQVDLGTILASIDATTDHDHDRGKIDDAAVAVESFTQLVDAVVEAASGVGLAAAPARRGFAGTDGLDYAFTVEEGAVALDSDEEALLVTLVGEPPAGIGIPQVLVAPADYECVPYPPAGGAEAPDCAPPQRFCFVYRRWNVHPYQYLSAQDGQAIADRTVVLPGMDVLHRQDAWASASISRNEELVPGKPSAAPFVYRTAEVRFANPLCPTLDVSDPIAIATIDSPSHDPVTRSLLAQLQTLFEAVLAKNSQPQLTFQVEAMYAYSLNPQLSPVPLPVLMQAPLTVDVGAGLQAMLADWAAAIELWFQSGRPTCGGVLWFDLTIMSNLTERPMPLLRLRQLYLPLEYVQPAVDCRTPAPTRPPAS
jgi:hypothetical protein